MSETHEAAVHSFKFAKDRLIAIKEKQSLLKPRKKYIGENVNLTSIQQNALRSSVQASHNYTCSQLIKSQPHQRSLRHFSRQGLL